MSMGKQESPPVVFHSFKVQLSSSSSDHLWRQLRLATFRTLIRASAVHHSPEVGSRARRGACGQQLAPVAAGGAGVFPAAPGVFVDQIQ